MADTFPFRLEQRDKNSFLEISRMAASESCALFVLVYNCGGVGFLSAINRHENSAKPPRITPAVRERYVHRRASLSVAPFTAQY